ncbi:MAG: efflux RND transporter periplasmic adaptor subunit [Pirellulaceae bacterium]|nr:efflux RND transporter periplasmic adaptor subunit [Pirellulaceae bacterium]
MHKSLLLAILTALISINGHFSLADEQVTVPIHLRGFERAEIMSRVEGFVDEVLVDIGDSVKKNQVLVKLRVPELNAELTRRQKMVEKARADFASQQADVTAIQAKLLASEAVEKLKAKELARYQRLVGSGALRQDKLDEAEFAHSSAQAERNSIKADVQAATAHAQAAQAAVEVALAEERKAAVMVDYLDIKAPFAGEIMRRGIDRGDLVQTPSATMPPLLVLVRTDRLRGLMMVMADHANHIEVGQPVEIHNIRGLPDQSITCQVSRLARSLAEGAQMMQVEVDLDNTADHNGDRRLKPGDYGKAIVSIPEHQ